MNIQDYFASVERSLRSNPLIVQEEVVPAKPPTLSSVLAEIATYLR